MMIGVYKLRKVKVKGCGTIHALLFCFIGCFKTGCHATGYYVTIQPLTCFCFSGPGPKIQAARFAEGRWFVELYPLIWNKWFSVNQ